MRSRVTSLRPQMKKITSVHADIYSYHTLQPVLSKSFTPAAGAPIYSSHTHTLLIKVGRCIWWIQNFKHLSTLPVSQLFLIKMIEGLENVWSPNQFTFKIQFCTCKTLISELYAFPSLAGMEINLHQLLKEILLNFVFLRSLFLLTNKFK